MFQITIKKPVSFSSIGLHSGKEVSITVYPANEDTGIVFKRLDIQEKKSDISVKYNNVTFTSLCTLIQNEDNIKVKTIEHFMSAISYLMIDNLIIELNSEEIPILDGSSIIFVEALIKAGLKQQQSKKKVLNILKPIILENTDWSIKVEPHKFFHVDVTIDFDNEIIGKESLSFNFIEQNYMTEIAKARTFALLKDIKNLHSLGFAKGGNLENAIVVDENKVLNTNGLRYKDEFVRHKILDLIGDLSLSGCYIKGKFTAYKCGHASNNEILRAIFADTSSYKILDMQEDICNFPRSLLK